MLFRLIIVYPAMKLENSSCFPSRSSYPLSLILSLINFTPDHGFNNICILMLPSLDLYQTSLFFKGAMLEACKTQSTAVTMPNPQMLGHQGTPLHSFWIWQNHQVSLSVLAVALGSWGPGHPFLPPRPGAPGTQSWPGPLHGVLTCRVLLLEAMNGGPLGFGLEQQQEHGFQDACHITKGEGTHQPALGSSPDGAICAGQAVQHNKQGPVGGNIPSGQHLVP